MNGPSIEERVVLLDDAGNPIGSAAKSTVHHRDTPFHLAFSCYIFDGAGRLLVTRRSLSKLAWPGVWTNSCCGHPMPGEPMVTAVERRVEQELGLVIDEPTCILPHFRYRATAADGTVENELCPVFCVQTRCAVAPATEEVLEWQWAPWSEFVSLAATESGVSPWAAQQVPQLVAAGVGGRFGGGD